MRFLIKAINCALLIIIMVGIPAVASASLGNLQVSSKPTKRMLILWGLSLAAIANAAGALGLIKNAKDRQLCRDWAFGFAGLLLIEYAYFQGYLNFDWLKQSLKWLQKKI